MLVKNITYVDYNGVERTEPFYFNLTESEIMDMQLTTAGGLDQILQNIIDSKDMPELIRLFKKIIFLAYGEKTPDGRRLRKSEEISKAFSETEAYNKLYMELVRDDKKAAEFINAVIPKVPTGAPIPPTV